MEQGEVVITLQRETEQRVAEAVLTEGHLADLLPPVLEGLKEAGYVIDDVKVGKVLTDALCYYVERQQT